ncbi:MAG: PAS domain-containing sensor histidine kinase [Gammaproteobacteria bacterium]|nr:PAS domain-containing sensor histidine kinase [Gammaproteobacteria bacterium]
MGLSKKKKGLSQNFSHLLDHICTVILQLNGAGTVLYINNSAEILLKTSAHHVLGLQIQEVIRDEGLLQTIEEVKCDHITVRRRGVTLYLGSGSYEPVNFLVTPISVHDQPSPDLLIEIVRIEHQLRASREEGLVAQQYATRALVRGLAHEIKNPLGGLRGAAQLLERELQSDELKEYTQIIVEEADRLKALIDRMLGPKTPSRQQNINLHEVLERVRQVISAESEQGIELIRDYDPSIPTIIFDKDHLIQAVLNLVRNALQAVAPKGGRITLKSRSLRQYTIGAKMHRLVAKIDVIDNGPGVDEVMGKSLFLPMVTGKEQGSGLGLPIAQSLVNLNGGMIEWDSYPGQTRFSILIPILNHELK